MVDQPPTKIPQEKLHEQGYDAIRCEHLIEQLKKFEVLNRISRHVAPLTNHLLSIESAG